MRSCASYESIHKVCATCIGLGQAQEYDSTRVAVVILYLLPESRGYARAVILHVLECLSALLTCWLCDKISIIGSRGTANSLR